MTTVDVREGHQTVPGFGKAPRPYLVVAVQTGVGKRTQAQPEGQQRHRGEPAARRAVVAVVAHQTRGRHESRGPAKRDGLRGFANASHVHSFFQSVVLRRVKQRVSLESYCIW